MAKRCGVCAKAYRTGQIGFVREKGRLRGCKVCPACVTKYGVLLIMATPAVELAPKRQKLSHSKLKTHLKAMAKVLAAGNVDGDLHVKSKIEGLESAIEAIDSGRFHEGDS